MQKQCRKTPCQVPSELNKLAEIILRYSLCVMRFRIFSEETMDNLPLLSFLSAVGQLRFRGTSVLFRLLQSCMYNVKRPRFVDALFSVDVVIILHESFTLSTVQLERRRRETRETVQESQRRLDSQKCRDDSFEARQWCER